jgi:hypothetical protein
MPLEELPIPQRIKDARKSMEICRILIVDQKPTFIITPNLWKDTAMWGLLLVDLARQVSFAYEREGIDKEMVLNRIKHSFEVEWNNPTE